MCAATLFVELYKALPAARDHLPDKRPSAALAEICGNAVRFVPDEGSGHFVLQSPTSLQPPEEQIKATILRMLRKAKEPVAMGGLVNAAYKSHPEARELMKSYGNPTAYIMQKLPEVIVQDNYASLSPASEHCAGSSRLPSRVLLTRVVCRAVRPGQAASRPVARSRNARR
jgi:hypothetical protein